MDNLELLNSIYEPLYKEAMNFLNQLKAAGYQVSWGYYGFHSIKKDKDFVTEYFPIPVITVQDICDIGIDINYIFIEVIFDRKKAVTFDYSLLSGYEFEVYGTNDYLKDFYNKELDIEGIPKRISESSEEKVGIAINLDRKSDIAILDIVKICNGYYQ